MIAAISGTECNARGDRTSTSFGDIFIDFVSIRKTSHLLSIVRFSCAREYHCHDKARYSNQWRLKLRGLDLL